MAEELIPLNAFKSVLTTLTGDNDVVYSAPKGVSTILLSAQITNTGPINEPVTISITSNRDLPVPQVDSISNAGNFLSASALIEKNQTFLEKESAAYINFQNNLTQIPFSFTSSFFEAYVRTAVDGVEADLIGIVTLVIKSTGSCSTLVGFDIVSDIALSKLTDADIEPVSAMRVLSKDCVTSS